MVTRIKRTRRFGGQIYDLRVSMISKEHATRIAKAVRSSGKKARIIQIQRGDYAVYVK